MAAAVSDTAWMTALLRFESALAAVEARLGIIPHGAASSIEAACEVKRFDVAAIGAAAVASASPVVPLVEALRREAGEPAAAYVHHGATSQDALDTAMMLVSRDALDVLIADLSRLAAECASLARRHRTAAMNGRTLMQRAQPITFGLKSANWLVGVLEARKHLETIRAGLLAVQLGGAVGTLDAFGDRGLDVVSALASELDLVDPRIPWHTVRTRVGALAGGLAMAAGAATKIALDVVLLAQSEVAEVAEASSGHSSSMPHKRNPVHAIEARAAFAGVVAQTSVLLGSLPGEHERAAGSWQAEWPALSEAFRLAAGAVNRATEAVTGLRVDIARMRANLPPEQRGGLDFGGAAAIIDRALAMYSKGESE
jgi:3-carboxy-cis,cis-muconate cycloisomerase